MLTSAFPRRRSRRLVVALGSAAVLTAAAACSGGSDPASESEGGSGGGDTATAASCADLVTAIQAPIRSLDPAQLNEGQQGLVWANGIYDNLIAVDNDAQIQPSAAESYEYSEDRRTLTFTLREGMTFSNGNPVTAEAARATMERTRTTPGPQQTKLSSVASIEAPDERTVVLNLSAPDATLLVSLAGGAGVIADPTTFDDPNLALDPVGSGAYTLSDETVDGSTYVLERREDHWNADAYPFERVTMRVIQDQTAVGNALQAGELNAASVQPNQLGQVEAAGFEISDPIPTAAGAILLLDREGTIAPAMADERVRQAINMAIDREGFVQALLQGSGEPTEQFANPAADLYVDELEGTYEFDPEAARELLAEAGYEDGFSMEMPSTVVSQRLEPLLSQALGDIGIDITWVPQPPSGLAVSMQSGDYPAVMWFGGLGLTEQEALDRFGEDAFFNPFRVPMPEAEELLAQAAVETDPDAQREIYQELGTLAVEEAHFAPIMYAAVLYATTDGIVYLPEGAPLPQISRWGCEG